MLNRRQFIGTLGTVGLVAGLAGCSSDDDEEDDGYKIAMVTDTTINDGGWGASCYNAMSGACDELGWTCSYSESVDTADWVTTMQAYVDLNYDLVFAPGNQYSDSIAQCADDNPEAQFCILNDDYTAENVEALVPDTAQIGQLAGVLAALLTKTKVIAFVGGTELDTTKSKLENYEAAAQAIDPEITVVSAYAGSFTDSAKGKELAITMVETNNADVFFGDASVVDTGVREALADYEGVYDIGQPSDLGGTDDDIIACSIVTDNQTMIEECMQDVMDGAFGDKIIYGDMSSDAIYVGTFSTAIVSDEIQAEYQTYVEQIEAGTFL